MDIHPDSLRKAGMGVKLVSEAGMIRSDAGAIHSDAAGICTAVLAHAGEDNAVGDRAPTYEELQQLRDMRRELNERYRADARSGLLRDSVMEAARNMPAVRVAAAPRLLTDGERRLVLGIADMHYGAEWEVRGLKREVMNAYNPEAFEKRMETLLAETAAILEKERIGGVTL